MYDEIDNETLDTFKDIAKQMQTSHVFASFVTKNFLKDVLCAFQVGMAVFTDKPIILIAVNGQKIPPRLEKIADKIIYYDGDDPDGLKRATTELSEYVADLAHSGAFGERGD